MEEEKVVKRCPMAMFGLCKHLACGHIQAHDVGDGCHSHEHYCSVKIGCSTIDLATGLIIDADAIEDFIFRFVGPKCSWYAFYTAMLKRIRESGLIVTPREEDLHLVKDVERQLEDSIEEYKIAQMEKEIVKLVKDGGKTFEAIVNLVSLWNLRDYGQSRSYLLKFLGIMEQKNLIVRARKGGDVKPDSFVYYAMCPGCGKSHKSTEGFNDCFERMTSIQVFGKEE